MQLAMLARDILLMAIPNPSPAYTISWEATLPVVCVAQAVAGTSCFRSIAALYPKIGRFAACLFIAALSLSALLSLAGLPLDLAHFASSRVLHASYMLYRWTETILAGGLILAVAFFTRFPSPLKRMPSNLIRHTALLASYFTLYAACYLMPLAEAQFTGYARLFVVCLLYAGWGLLMTKEGQISEEWPLIDPAIAAGIKNRYAEMERLYHQAASESLRSSVSGSK